MRRGCADKHSVLKLHILLRHETNIYDDASSLTYMEASCPLLESRLEAHPKGLNNNDIGNVLNTP